MSNFSDPNFKEETLRIINTYGPLADWFKRNRFPITYYELTQPRFEFEGENYFSRAQTELRVLKKMTDISLMWLGTKYQYSEKEKALRAALAISQIYEAFSDSLNADAKKNFQIDVEGIDRDFFGDVLNPPDLVDLEIKYLENKKNNLLSEISNIDEKLSKLKNSNQNKI